MTAIPAAIDSLLALLRTAQSLAGVRIEDGPWLDRPVDPDVVAVGWLPEEGPTVEWSNLAAGLNSDQESFDLQGLASSWSGDTDIKAVRDRVDQLVESIKEVISLDRTLNGSVSTARLITGSFTQYQTASGCEAVISFAVHADLF